MAGGLFNEAFSALGKFFSRSFWLGTFTPLAAVAALHLLIATQVFPDDVKLSDWPTEVGSTLTVSGLAFAGLIVLAYAISPFTPVLRGLLDGHLLPGFIRQPLRRARYQTAYAAKRRLQAQGDALAALQELHAFAPPALEAAAAMGDLQPPPSPVQVDRARDAVRSLQAVLSTGDPPDIDDLRAVYLELWWLLGSARSSGLDPDAQALNLVWREFVEVLESTAGLAETEFELQASRTRAHWNLPASEATAVGDSRQVVERYSYVMYGAGFDYLWPRLQVLLDSATKEDESLEAAQTQIDFAVTALALSLTVPLVWLPLIGLHGTSLTLLLAVAAFGPVAWVFFYQLVVQSQAAFGGVVQALIDRRHLDLLEGMQLGRPATTGEERELWQRLQAGDHGASPSLRYAPKAPAA